MYQKYFLIILLLFFITACKKKDDLSITPPDVKESYLLYEKAVTAMNEGEFFFAAKTFSEAESILPIVEHSAKASLMSAYCYYSINFYDEAISALENFLRKYLATLLAIYVLPRAGKPTITKTNLSPAVPTSAS